MLGALLYSGGMSVKPPNAVEFGLLIDPKMPGHLTDPELAATYGVDTTQIAAWKQELKTTGRLAQGAKAMPRDRSMMVRSIIDSCLQTILDVASMPTQGMTVKEKIRHMEACSHVLARVQPYVQPEEVAVVIDEHDAFAMVERASRSADVVLH